MLETISQILTAIDDFVWGIPLIVLILVVGIFLTIRLKGLQITKLPLAIKHIIANENPVTKARCQALQHCAPHCLQRSVQEILLV